jgi:hypothetical protein
MTRLRTTAVALALGFASNPALADGTLATVAPDGMVTTIATDTANPSGLILAASKPTIQAAINTDEKIATVTGTVNLTPRVSNDAENTFLTISAQTPLAQGQSYTNTVTLDGLTKSTALSFKLTHAWGGYVKLSGDVLLNSRAYQAACAKIYALTESELPDNFKLQPMPKLCSDDAIDQALQTRIDWENENKDKLSPAQIASDRQIEQRVKSRIPALLDMDAPDPKDFTQLSLNGKVGYEQHAYYDPITLAPSTTNKTPWQVGVSLGYIPKSADYSFNFGFNYQEAFLDSDFGKTQVKCINSGATCVNGFIGAPTLQDKALLSFDFRWAGKLPVLNIQAGIDPGITYDAVADSEAFQFPLYLISDSDHHLTGGIRYDWTSTTHTSTVGIFVSSAFSIFEGG